MFLFLSPSTFLTCPLFYFSFSVSLLFFCFLFPSCLSFLLSFVTWFLSLSFISFLLCFCFMKITTSKYSIAIFSLKSFLLFWFLCCFLFQNPFFYLCCFLILSYVFYSTSRFLISKHTTSKKRNFWVKRGVATKRGFFINLCFEKCEKLWLFLGPFFWQFLGDVQKTL